MEKIEEVGEVESGVEGSAEGTAGSTVEYEIITREEAKEKGLKCYFTGKPCKHGHVTKRVTKDGQCHECKVIRIREHHSRNREKMHAYYKEYRERNKEKIAERNKIVCKAYYEKNKKEFLEKCRVYYQENKDKKIAYQKEYRSKNYEKVSARNKKYLVENREYLRPFNRAKDARRKAAELRCTPSWANQEAIKEIYKEAQRLTEETGIVHHVDHIIPLQGKTVCGFHVENNLRPLPATENKKKANKLIEDL